METIIIIAAVALLGVVAWQFLKPSKKASEGSIQRGASSGKSTKKGEKERQK